MNIQPLSIILLNKHLKKIKTIGNTVVLYDQNNELVYKSHIKPDINRNNYSIDIDKNSQEFESLNSLYLLGINVPKTLGISIDVSTFAMEYKYGKTLDEYLNTNQYIDNFFVNLGDKIYKLHCTLKNKQLTNILKDADPYLNSQCALNFNTLTVKWLEPNPIKLKKNEEKIFEIFMQNIQKAKNVLARHQNYLKCNATTYGDLKPDNIIVCKEDELCFIDPIISKARTSCDLGKLLSRLILLNPVLHTNKCKLIIKSYYGNKISYKSIKEIEFMLAVDMLNIYSRNLSIQSRSFPSYYIQMQKNYYYCFTKIIPKLLNQKVFFELK